MSLQRGALDLLNNYNSESSDDEVPGCRVSVKRVHKHSDSEEESKLKLPVPSIITSGEKTVHDEDPSQHDGRVRTFPHERGNWATYVYIPYTPSCGVKKLMDFLVNLPFSNFHLKQTEDLHISLTKTVILRHHWIDAFVQTIKESFHFTRFLIFFDNLQVYCNEERTRTFIGIQIKSGYDTLLNMVHCLDKCLKEFRQPKFYKNPSFHLSIAWCVGDHKDEISSILPELNVKFQELSNEYPQDNWYIFVNYVHCKIGCKMYTLPLA